MQVLLSDVGLGYLLKREGGLNAVEEWADSLSLGEQQRLGTHAGSMRVPAVTVSIDASLAVSDCHLCIPIAAVTRMTRMIAMLTQCRLLTALLD